MDEFVQGYEYICSHPGCVGIDDSGMLFIVGGVEGVPSCVEVFVRARNEQERAEQERDKLRKNMGLCSDVSGEGPRIKIFGK